MGDICLSKTRTSATMSDKGMDPTSVQMDEPDMADDPASDDLRPHAMFTVGDDDLDELVSTLSVVNNPQPCLVTFVT